MNNKLFFMRDITLFITLYVLLTANLSATVKNEFSPVDSLSGTPWCIDDIAIEMNYFQPVQVVWNDDPDYESDVKIIDYNHAEITMEAVKDKSTLLFGQNPEQDKIDIWIYNYYTVRFYAAAQFTMIDPDNNKTILYTTGLHDLPRATEGYFCNEPGIYQLTLKAPIPENPFTFTKPGTYTIEMEILISNSGGDLERLNDADPSNQIFRITVDVVETAELWVEYRTITYKDDATNKDLIEEYSWDLWSISDKFLNGILPLGDNDYWDEVGKIHYGRMDHDFWRTAPEELLDLAILIEAFYLDKNISLNGGYTDRVVGIIKPPNYFRFANGAIAFMFPMFPKVVFVNSDMENVVSSLAYPSSIAHEFGHTFGLWLGANEEYDLFNPGRIARGYWVKQDKWRDTRFGSSEHNPPDRDEFICIMGAGETIKDPPEEVILSYENNWIDKDDYKQTLAFFQKPKIDPEVIEINGRVFDEKGEFLPFYQYSEGFEELEPCSSGTYMIRTLNQLGEILNEYGFEVSFKMMLDYKDSYLLDTMLFSKTIIYTDEINEIQLLKNGNLIAQRVFSENKPEITDINPNGDPNLTINHGETIEFKWDGIDLDGDDLFYSVVYSEDTSKTWSLFSDGVDLSYASYLFNSTRFDEKDLIKFKVIVTDGVNTNESDVVDITFTTASSDDLVYQNHFLNCYPNPFRNQIMFDFELSAPGNIQLNITNQLGQILTTVLDEQKPSGKHKVRFKAPESWPEGIYYVTMKNGNEVYTEKLVLSK